MAISFAAKLAAVQAAHQSDIGLLISPRFDRLPLLIQRHDEPFLPFGKAVIDATHDLVCAYIFDFPAYLALGAAGAIALERTIDYVNSALVTILHGGFALPEFTVVSDENAFGVDAVTLSSNEYINAFTTRADRGAFIMNWYRANTIDAPDIGGIYWIEEKLFTLAGEDGQILKIRLAGVPTPQPDEAFGDTLRSQIEQLRND